MQLSFERILRTAVQYDASDIHIKANTVPKIRIKGALKAMRTDELSNDDIQQIINSVMPERVQHFFSLNNEADFAFEVEELGRFRFNAYKTRGLLGMVGRIVTHAPPMLDDLGIPEVAKEVALEPNGLVIVSGATGVGKSTTIAGMINHINLNRFSHIVTIEDPIEIVHHDIKSSISQREVASDTNDFSSALRSSLRQDPDVIMIGEMRDVETARTALSAAETGHLVLTTLHTTAAADTVSRIIDLFPAHEQQQIRSSLAASLRAILCQKLIATSQGSIVPVVEVMLGKGRIPEAILKPEMTHEIPTILSSSQSYKMQTFDDHLFSLIHEEKITPQEALTVSSSAREFKLKLRQMGISTN